MVISGMEKLVIYSLYLFANLLPNVKILEILELAVDLLPNLSTLKAFQKYYRPECLSIHVRRWVCLKGLDL